MRISDSFASAKLVGRFAVSLTSGLLVALAASTALAAAPKPAAPAPEPIQARYAEDRAKCLSGTSPQDTATCLREAGAARDAASKQQLDNGGSAPDRNAKTRCDALTGDDAKDCLARVAGQGKKSGSVEGGGILRETVTREVKPAEPAASAP